MSKLFVGCDISKDNFDICFIDENENILFQAKLIIGNDGFNILLSELKKYHLDDIVIVMESTAIYHLTLLSFLLTHKYKIAVVNPYLVKSFIESDTLRLSKSDKKDAFHISKFALEKYKKLSFYDIDSFKNIKPLLRERDVLIKEIGKIKTSARAIITQVFPELEHEVHKLFSNAMLNVLYSYPSAIKIAKVNNNKLDKLLTNRTKIDAIELKKLAHDSIGIDSTSLNEVLKSKIRRLISLTTELDILEKLLVEHIEQDQIMQKNKEILESIPGVGVVSSKSFLIEIETINRFNSVKNLSAFIGIDPSFYQSGKVNIKGSISRRGNKYLRNIIWQMAVSVIKNNLKFKEYYLKKRGEGKRYKEAVIAVANKLLRTIFALLTKQMKFDEKIAFSR
jgi:transposase